MVPALAGRVEAVHEPVAGCAAGAVVVRLAVGEAVGHDEVDDLVGRRRAHRWRDEQLVARLEARAAGHLDGRDVGRRVPAERDPIAGGGHGEGEVGAVGDAARAVVLVPAPRTGRPSTRSRRPGSSVVSNVGHAVAVDVLQPRPQAVRLPVAGTAELGLEAAGGGGDALVDVVGDPVRVVRVVEAHARRRAERQGDVGAATVAAVALGPGAVEGGLVLPGAGRQIDVRRPDVVAGFVGQPRDGALGLPVTGAAELGLERAGQRDRARRRGLGDRRRSRRGGRCRQRGGQECRGAEDPAVDGHDVPLSWRARRRGL